MQSKNGASQFWTRLLKVKDVFYRFYDRIMVSGNKTSFWKDAWYHKKPLSERFHRLYELSFNRVIKVDKVISSFGACLLFRRTLWGDLAKEWFDLLNIIHTTVLREGEIGLFGNWVKKVSLSNLFIMLYRLDSLLRVLRPLWNMED
jgi:hypothetical protein